MTFKVLTTILLHLLLSNSCQSYVQLQAHPGRHVSQVQLRCLEGGGDLRQSSGITWSGLTPEQERNYGPEGQYVSSLSLRGEKDRPLDCRPSSNSHELTGEHPLCGFNFQSAGWQLLKAHEIEEPRTFGPVLDHRWESFPLRTTKGSEKINFELQRSKTQTTIVHFSVKTRGQVLVYLTQGRGSQSPQFLIAADIPEGNSFKTSIMKCGSNNQGSKQFKGCNVNSRLEPKSFKVEKSRVVPEDTWTHLTVHVSLANRRVDLLKNGTVIVTTDLGAGSSLDGMQLLTNNGDLAFWKIHDYPVLVATAQSRGAKGTFSYTRAEGSRHPACVSFLLYSAGNETHALSFTVHGAINKPWNREYSSTEQVQARRGWQTVQMDLPFSSSGKYEVSIVAPQVSGEIALALADMRQCYDGEYRMSTVEVPRDRAYRIQCSALKKIDGSTNSTGQLIQGQPLPDTVACYSNNGTFVEPSQQYEWNQDQTFYQNVLITLVVIEAVVLLVLLVALVLTHRALRRSRDECKMEKSTTVYRPNEQQAVQQKQVP